MQNPGSLCYIRRRRTVTCSEQQKVSSSIAGVVCSIELVISLSQVLSTCALSVLIDNWKCGRRFWKCVVECGAEWRGMVASRGKRSRCVGTSVPSTTRIHSHTLTLSHWDSASTTGLAQNIATVVMNDIYQDSIKQRK